MHIPGEPGNLIEAVERVNNGELNGLCGRMYRIQPLLRALSDLKPNHPLLIENAVLRCDRDPTIDGLDRTWSTFDRHVIFRHCTFYGSPAIDFNRWTFKDGLTLQNCRAQGAISFRYCQFDFLSFDNFVASEEVKIQDCEFIHSLPNFEDCHFAGPTEFVFVAVTPLRNPRIDFKRCVFRNDMRLETVARTPAGEVVQTAYALSVRHSEFGHGCTAHIRLGENVIADTPADTSEIELYATRLDGRLRVLLPDGAPRRNISVALDASSIAGDLDLSAIPLKPLRLQGVSFAGGQLTIRPEDLFPPEPAPSSIAGWLHRISRIFVCPPDGPGNLASERVALDPENKTANGNPYIPVMIEYGELRNAFARVAGAIELEEFCHYKFRDYRRLAWEWDRNHPPETGRVLGRPQLANRPTIVIDKMYKYLLGYGMYARRVILSAAVVILMFAALYGFQSRCREGFCNLGHVESNGCLLIERPKEKPTEQDESSNHLGVVKGEVKNEKGECIFPGNPQYEYAGCFASCRQSIYYSTVTFTTLGYGDYCPKGNLQFAAAAESLIGGLMLAFLTVVFARKFIR